MKEIRNKTQRPMRIPLPGGKTLFLGPAQVAQIADSAAEHPGVEKLVEDGSIEILGKGERVSGPKGSGTAQARSQGGAKTFRRGTGDR